MRLAVSFMNSKSVRIVGITDGGVQMEANYVVVVAVDQAEMSEPIVWHPMYITLAVLIVVVGTIIHVSLTRRRKQEEKTGKRGL